MEVGLRNRMALGIRLVALADGKESFTYKDYSQDGRRREMMLPVEEFIHRFLLHILPHRFVRIRYYGLFANRHRERQLARCRTLLDAAPPAKASKSDEREDWESVYQRVTGRDPTHCVHCGHGRLRQVRKLPALARRPPP